MGVSTRPHSLAARKPVISPAPLSTVAPAGTGSRNSLGRRRHDRRHARASDPAAAALVAPDRHVPDPDPGDVGDRVLRPRLQRADPHSELARARAAGWRRAGHGAQP
jgi:hypothetical protein